jgi:hypothetical protein
MNLFSLITDLKFSLQVLKLDADNDTYYGAGIDMAKYKHVAFVGAVLKGEVKTNSLKVQQSSVSVSASMNDLEGTSVDVSTTVGADGFAVVEVKHVQKRYVRPALVIANYVTPTAACVIGIAWGRTQYPDTNTGSESHVAPAEGTA